MSGSAEEIRKRLATDFYTRLPQYIARLTWPQEKLGGERELRLRQLLKTAKEKSNWHRMRLSDIDPETIRVEDLSRSVPVMTKADLMQNWNEIVTDKRLSLELVETHLEEHGKELAYLLDEFVAMSSGGSSGQRGIFVMDLNTFVETSLRAHSRFIRRYSILHKLTPPDTQVICFVGGGSSVHMSVAGYKTFWTPKIKLFVIDITRPLEDVVRELNSIQPFRLDGYPSALKILSEEAKERRLKINPTMSLAQAEPLYPDIRKSIESAWPGISIFSHYGSTESGFIGVTCGENDPPGSMHLVEDGVIIEPVDADGRPVAPGELASKIYVTNLINTLLPMIRYELTDRITLLDTQNVSGNECSCGCTFRRIANIQGRLEDVFVYHLATGKELSVDVDAFETPLNEYRNIVQHQVRQTPNGVEVLIVSKGDVAVANVESDIRRTLQEIGLTNATVSVKVVDELGRTHVGKTRRYVPLPK